LKKLDTMATHAAAMLLTIAMMTSTALAQGEYLVDPLNLITLNLITSPNSCDATPKKFAIINFYDDPVCFTPTESLPVYLDVCCFDTSSNKHHQTRCFDEGDGHTGISVTYGSITSCGNSSTEDDSKFFYDGYCEGLPNGKSMKLESSPCKVGVKPDWLSHNILGDVNCTEPSEYVLYEAYLDSNCSSDKFIKYATLPVGQCCDWMGRGWSNNCRGEFPVGIIGTNALVAAQLVSCKSKTESYWFATIWADSLSCSGFGGTYNRMSSVSSRTCGNRFNNASSPRRPSPMAPLEVTTSLPVGIIAGATAGGAVFGFLLLAAIGVAMYFLVYKRKNSGTSVVLQSPMVEDDIKVHSMDVRPAP